MANTYGKRLVPEYLITKLEELEPGGGDYTAGDGIEISDENVISVDTDTIETKSHASSTYLSYVSLTDGAINDGISVTDYSSGVGSSLGVSDQQVSLTSGDVNGIMTGIDVTNTQVKIELLDTASLGDDETHITINSTGTNINTPILEYNSVEVATVNDVPTTATSTSTVTPTTETLTFTYSDNTTGTITIMTAATVSTTTTLS